MRKLYKIAVITALISLAGTSRAGAQLAPFGESGVVQGHIHLAVRDVEAAQKLFVVLGGTPVKNGALQLIQFPGTFVMLRKAEPTGGSVGSTIGHFGFLVKDLKAFQARLQAADVKWEDVNRRQDGSLPYVAGPDGVRIEIIEDKTIETPIKMHHVHFFTGVPLETQAWYARTFGAKPGKRGQQDAADLPGVNLTFAKTETPLAGTKGRSLDHIGFEVNGLEAFIKKLEASGIKMDSPYTKLPNSQTAIAFLTDPWGTYIELTENLAPEK
jgi:catechol 2,3-dioxygenase-like lactoylglutathione lyase family enzyme